MGTLDGKFSPDDSLSPERANEANARLEMEKELKMKERDQFTSDFGLDDLLSEYSQEIPGFDKIRDQIIDELMGFVKTKKRFNDPKDKQILMDTVQDKFVKRIEGLKEAS